MNAIFEATVQLLVAEGSSKLTTTRIAERAGVSVGTMYQYFSHKEALLYAIVEQNLDRVSEAVELACEHLMGEEIEVITAGLIQTYIDAKTHHIEASQALYFAARDLNLVDLTNGMSRRIFAAVKTVLGSARDIRFDDLDTVAFIVQHALSGTVRAVFESEDGPTPAAVETLRGQLPLLCRAYLSIAVTV